MSRLAIVLFLSVNSTSDISHASPTGLDVCKSIVHDNLNPEAKIAACDRLVAMSGRENGWRGEIFYYRGVAYQRLGKFDEAIADFTRAVQLRADFVDAFFMRGRAYAEKGLFDLAIADYGEAIRLEPICEAFVYRSEAYGKQGRGDLAAKHDEADWDCHFLTEGLRF